MIKPSQTYRNKILQYKMQQNVFRAKNWSLPPYIIKFASVLLPKKTIYTKAIKNYKGK